eukprot:TRINITY_DN16884_c0_g1_i1.p1 TRINITY_DN16884_c0_g1~~TRINITY_DN16884_c0_g1_i1.p1  ORF type:complete len:334 (+),score=20.56 TRINITY_DN16884_c0_g1_i1:32-1033(+)
MCIRDRYLCCFFSAVFISAFSAISIVNYYVHTVHYTPEHCKEYAWEELQDVYNRDHLSGVIAKRPASFFDKPLDFFAKHVRESRPAIITGEVNSYTAYNLWSESYFRELLGQDKITVEVSLTDHFGGPDAQTSLETMTWTDFLDEYNSPSRKRNYYLAETLLDDFPKIANDVPRNGPSFFPDSSLMRLSRTQLWVGYGGQITPTHHDQYENVLCQIKGKRHVTLFPPFDGAYLYSYADSVYTAVDVANPDYQRFPKYHLAHPQTLTLNPGECLFLPAFWWHHIQGEGASIAVNYWFKPYSPLFSDVWGNILPSSLPQNYKEHIQGLFGTKAGK